LSLLVLRIPSTDDDTIVFDREAILEDRFEPELEDNGQ
jgi:hypothetical protein